MKTTIVASLLAIMATTINGYCPNLCSGHGTCGAKDICTCYSHIGTNRGDFYTDISASNYGNDLQKSWTGADCSLRTCPQAYSFSGSSPSGLSEKVNLQASISQYARVITATVADPTTWNVFTAGSKIRLETTATLASEVLTIQSVTHDGTVATINVYEKISVAYTTADSLLYSSIGVDSGNAAASNDPKHVQGAHALAECAGQGLCDRTTGACECFPGYDGEACTRTVCPNECSGHGICLSLNRLASDGGETYTQAWDADKHYGCKCDAGFRGPDCSLQECPSDYDPLYGCGGGVCNAGGASCDNNNKSDCESSAATGVQQRDCSGRGLCDYETGICKCFNGYYGQACAQQTILI